MKSVFLLRLNESLEEVKSNNNSKIFVDTSRMLVGRPETYDSNTLSYTATEDCYFSYNFFGLAQPIFRIDNNVILKAGIDSKTGLCILCWSGFLKQGQTVSWQFGGRWSAYALKN